MDIVIRATIAFFFVFMLTRIVGRRELSSLEPFDLILLVMLGDLVQQGITQSDESVTGTLIVISTIALLSIAVSWVSFRVPRTRVVMEGEPIVLVQDGGPEIEVDSRPSDAIALAVRADAEIFVADEVIDESAIEFQGEEISDTGDLGA